MKTINPGLRRVTDKEREQATAKQQLVGKAFPRKEITYQGVTLRLYSIAWLASLCEKSPKTICAWERQKVFPRPLFTTVDGYRWYCAAELEGYSKLIKAAGLRKGRYNDGVKQTDFLKTNAFAFKMRLKEFLEHEIGKFPTRHKHEEEFIRNMAKKPRLKITPEVLAQLIKQ